MAHHGSPEGVGQTGGPAADQPYVSQPGYQVPQQPTPGHDQGNPYASPAPAYGAPQGIQPSYGPPPAPDQGYATQQVGFNAPTQQTGFMPPAPGYAEPQPPMSAPPMTAYPTSGAPVYPTSGSPVYPTTGGFGAQPVTGAVSGPGFGVPGQPAYGQTGYQPAVDPATGMPVQGPPPRKKRGVAVPLLSGLLVLALIAAGVLVGLYLDKSNKLTKSDKVVAQQHQAIADRDDELKRTKADLQTKTDDLATAQQNLRGTQADNTETKREKDIISKCLSLINDALAAKTNADFDTKWKALAAPCAQADAVLGL